MVVGNTTLYYRPHTLNSTSNSWDDYDIQLGLFNALTTSVNNQSSLCLDDDALVSIRTGLRLLSGYRLEDPETQKALTQQLQAFHEGESFDEELVAEYAKEIEDMVRERFGISENQTVYAFHVIYDLDRYLKYKDANNMAFCVELYSIPKSLSDVHMIYANDNGEGLVVSSQPFETIRNRGILKYDKYEKSGSGQPFQRSIVD